MIKPLYPVVNVKTGKVYGQFGEYTRAVNDFTFRSNKGDKYAAVIAKRDDISKLSGQALVAVYNHLAGTEIEKFSTRAAGEARLLKFLQPMHSNLTSSSKEDSTMVPRKTAATSTGSTTKASPKKKAVTKKKTTAKKVVTKKKAVTKKKDPVRKAASKTAASSAEKKFAGYDASQTVTPKKKPDTSPYREGIRNDVYRGLTAKKMTVGAARDVCGGDPWHLRQAVKSGAVSIK